MTPQEQRDHYQESEASTHGGVLLCDGSRGREESVGTN